MKSIKTQKGFTLIELLIVITIIGLLAVGAINIFANAQGKARDSQRLIDIGALNTAMKLYYNEKAAVVRGDDVGTDQFQIDTSKDIPQELDQELTGTYIDKVPLDPLGEDDTYYLYTYVIDNSLSTPDLTAYEFNAQLEVDDTSTDSDDSDFEANGNELNDGGNADDLFEVGSKVDDLGRTSAGEVTTSSGTIAW